MNPNINVSDQAKSLSFILAWCEQGFTSVLVGGSAPENIAS